jgi:two-component system sensor histidine kinase ResE
MPEIDPVWMAPDKISRVLHNLLENAIHHTPIGGAVHINAEHLAKEQLVQITVSDSGPGIPADDLPHVFERFYRGEKSRTRNGSGAGLGLAIAKGIVEAHQGKIWIESDSSTGTSFHFTLPKGPA